MTVFLLRQDCHGRIEVQKRKNIYVGDSLGTDRFIFLVLYLYLSSMLPDFLHPPQSQSFIYFIFLLFTSCSNELRNTVFIMYLCYRYQLLTSCYIYLLFTVLNFLNIVVQQSVFYSIIQLVCKSLNSRSLHRFRYHYTPIRIRTLFVIPCSVDTRVSTLPNPFRKLAVCSLNKLYTTPVHQGWFAKV